MARNRFGGSASTFVVADGGAGTTYKRLATPPELTFWSGPPTDLDRVAYDDLRALDDPTTVITSVTALSNGDFPEFYGPDDAEVLAIWVSADAGTSGTWISANTPAAAIAAAVATEAGARADADEAKAPLASPAFTGTPTGITKAHVGLPNVDNTSDANKPVSTAQQTAINDAVSALLAGAPGALDTLNELAAALDDDASFAASVTMALGTKVNSSTYNAALAAIRDLTDLTLSTSLTNAFGLAGTVPAIWHLDAMAGADDDAKFAAALAAWSAAARGGKIVLGARTHTFANPWVIPNDGASVPAQKTLVIEGQGAGHSSSGVPNGGTIVDLNYNGGAQAAKIDSRGWGLLAMRDFTLRDISNTGSLPFVQVTNTTLIAERLEFWGRLSQENAYQDAILLGGGTRDIDGSATAKMNGYKPIVKDCHFHRIRRAVWLRPGCNDALIQGNTIWTDCGAPDDTYGGIQLTGDATGSIVGNVIADNTLECSHYPNMVKCDGYAKHNIFRHNGMYDATATTVCAISFADNATHNSVIPGYWDGSFPMVKETITSFGTNQILQTTTGIRPSYQAQDAVVKGAVAMVRTGGVGVSAVGTAGDRTYMRCKDGAAGSPSYPETILVTSVAVLVTDLVTTSGSPIVTSATAAFTADHKYMPIAATGLPSNTRIRRYISATSVELSDNATVTATGVTAQIGRVPTNTGGTAVDEVGFSRRHIITKGAIGAVASQTAGAGSTGNGAAASGAGTDTAFTLTVTTASTGTGVGAVATVTYGVAFNSTGPKFALCPKNAAAATAMRTNDLYVTSSNSVFTLNAGVALPVSTTLIFDVLVMQ